MCRSVCATSGCNQRTILCIAATRPSVNNTQFPQECFFLFDSLCRMQFLNLQIELIDSFRRRLIQLHNSIDDNNVTSPVALNAINYIVSVLREWGENTVRTFLNYRILLFNQLVSVASITYIWTSPKTRMRSRPCSTSRSKNWNSGRVWLSMSWHRGSSTTLNPNL